MSPKSASRPAVTIYEIAEHVGMSPAAVSSALSNRGVERRLSEDTVRRIREAAAELGYVPNMAGRRLRAHKAATRQFDLAILTSFEAPLPLAPQPSEVAWTGVPPKPAWNWWHPVGKELVTQWRTTPAVIDWNQDGLPDLVVLDPDGSPF